jgi:hypothetical protein
MAKTRIKRKYQFGGDFKNWQSENKGAAAALGAGLGTIGTGLDMVTGKMDNISDTGQTINKTFGSMENAAMASGNPIAMMAGGASKLLRLPINAIVNKIKENKQDPRHDEQYDPTLQNVVANPFGMAKYGMKLYQDGGMIEAEGNETMELNTNQIKNIEGPSHNQGGVDINLKGNEEYIYSDSLGYDKKGLPTLDKKLIKTSFADKSKTIENKYKSKFDNVSQTSKEIELEMLKKDSEMMRMVKEAMVAKPTKGAPKFALGGDPYKYNQNDYTAWMKANNPNNLNLKSQEAIDYFRPLYGKELYSKYGEQGVNEFAKYKPFDVSGITQNQPASLSPNTTGVRFKDHYPIAMTPFTRNAALKDSSSLSVRDKDGQFDYEGFPKSDLRTGGDFNKTEITKGDKLQIAGMVPGLAYNLFNALKKPEKIGVQYNPNANEAENLMENRRFDMQPYINDARLSYNTYKDNISNQSSSSATRNANLQKALSNTTSSLNKIRTMEQQTNNQYRADEAQLKQLTGAEKVAARNLQEQLQTQTNAAKQMAGATAATQMGQFLSEFGKTKNQGLTNEMYAEVLRNLTTDFTIPEITELLKGLKIQKK